MHFGVTANEDLLSIDAMCSQTCRKDYLLLCSDALLRCWLFEVFLDLHKTY